MISTNAILGTIGSILIVGLLFLGFKNTSRDGNSSGSSNTTSSKDSNESKK